MLLGVVGDGARGVAVLVGGDCSVGKSSGGRNLAGGGICCSVGVFLVVVVSLLATSPNCRILCQNQHDEHI